MKYIFILFIVEHKVFKFINGPENANNLIRLPIVLIFTVFVEYCGGNFFFVGKFVKIFSKFIYWLFNDICKIFNAFYDGKTSEKKNYELRVVFSSNENHRAIKLAHAFTIFH